MRQLENTMFKSNCLSFHLCWKENFLKHQSISKYYETDCRFWFHQLRLLFDTIARRETDFFMDVKWCDVSFSVFLRLSILNFGILCIPVRTQPIYLFSLFNLPQAFAASFSIISYRSITKSMPLFIFPIFFLIQQFLITLSVSFLYQLLASWVDLFNQFQLTLPAHAGYNCKNWSI